MKIHQHGVVEENIAFNLYAKFNDDQLRNEKAVVLWKFDSNNPNNKQKHKNNVHGHWEPVSSCSNNKIMYFIKTSQLILFVLLVNNVIK